MFLRNRVLQLVSKKKHKFKSKVTLQDVPEFNHFTDVSFPSLTLPAVEDEGLTCGLNTEEAVPPHTSLAAGIGSIVPAEPTGVGGERDNTDDEMLLEGDMEIKSDDENARRPLRVLNGEGLGSATSLQEVFRDSMGVRLFGLLLG